MAIRRKKLSISESWGNKKDAEKARRDYKKFDKSIIVKIKKEGVWYNVYTNLI